VNNTVGVRPELRYFNLSWISWGFVADLLRITCRLDDVSYFQHVQTLRICRMAFDFSYNLLQNFVQQMEVTEFGSPFGSAVQRKRSWYKRVLQAAAETIID